MNDGESIEINDIIEAFGILCHGCEAIRQSSSQLLVPTEKQIKKSEKNKTQKPQSSKPNKSTKDKKKKKV